MPPDDGDDGATAIRCPICMISCLTLGQLNAHLDDVHFMVNEDRGQAQFLKQWLGEQRTDGDDQPAPPKLPARPSTAAGGGGGSASLGGHLSDQRRRSSLSASQPSLHKPRVLGGGATSAAQPTRSTARPRQRSSSETPSFDGSGGGTLQAIADSIRQLPFSKIVDEVRGDLRQLSSELAGEMSLMSSPEDGNDSAAPPTMKRDHYRQNTTCPTCSKPLSSFAASLTAQHCRRCGYLFCDQDCQREMRLNAQALHDPGGVWCRVCRRCFENRPGYRDTEGAHREWTEQWARSRRTAVERVQMDITRLTRRYERLCALYGRHFGVHTVGGSGARGRSTTPSGRRQRALTSSSIDSAASHSSSNSSSYMQVLPSARTLREAEQQITPWQRDDEVVACPLCLNAFPASVGSSSIVGLLWSSISAATVVTAAADTRRHHCRLCGKVVCGREKCSAMKPLTTEAVEVGQVRMCTDCDRTLQQHATEREQMSAPPPLMTIYSEMAHKQQEIIQHLPSYNDALLTIQARRGQASTGTTGAAKNLLNDPSFVTLYRRAGTQRSRLTALFGEYEQLARRIAALPAEDEVVKRVHRSMLVGANQFLQNHMFSLQLLPKLADLGGEGRGGEMTTVTEQLSDDGDASSATATATQPSSFLASLFKSSTPTPAAAPTQPVKLSPEALQLLSVLSEQIEQIQRLIGEAAKERRWADVVVLKRNMGELEQEVAKLRSGSSE